MRLAFLTHQWPNARMGGIGSYTLTISRCLAAHGHEVHVFTPTLPKDVADAVPSGIQLHNVPDIAMRVADKTLDGSRAAALYAGGDAVYRLAQSALLCDAVRNFGQTFDVVEAPEYEALALPLQLDPPASTAIVTNLHSGSAINRLGNEIPTDDEQRVFDAFEFAAIALADGVCAPTKIVVEQTRGFFPFSREVQVIPTPVNCPARPFSPPPEDGSMLYVGRLERLKGIGVLTEALNLALPRDPRMSIRIIGPDTATAPGGGSMQQWVQSRLAPKGRNRVHLLGPMSEEQIRAELAKCRFVVIPSLHENFSIVCVQAMAAGRTVIASNGTGTPEVIGPAGRFFDRGSAQQLAGEINWLYNNPDSLADLSKRAYERATTAFDPKRIAAARTEYYEKMVTHLRQKGRAAVGDRLAELPQRYAAALFKPLAQMTAAICNLSASQVQTPGHRLVKVIEDGVLDSARCGGEVLLYGAGKHTSRLLGERDVWESRGHRVTGVIDDDPRFAVAGTFMNLPVMSTGTALRRVREGQTIPPIVLSSDSVEDLLWDRTGELRRQGVKVFRLYGR
jgi:1,4-alpha-glucan branching enzyme